MSAPSLPSAGPSSLRDSKQESAEPARAHRGSTITFSPKAFLPLTNLCRNFCDYCSFRRSPNEPGEWTMSPSEVLRTLKEARRAGCVEALFCLGDTPETTFPSYRNLLESWGFEDTVEYIRWACEQALSLGLLPHTNAGILSQDGLRRLRPVNVSMGLMLETVSERLCHRGMPHHRAPDKRPEVRVQMLRDAGRLKIPFTTGVLVGIGETRDERIDSLKCIAALHRESGHIQEVILQNFRHHPHTPMENHPNASQNEMLETIALARRILPSDISLQAPPNLNGSCIGDLFEAGINDLGGISPLTPDYINPGHPWPHLKELAGRCEDLGYSLEARLPVYPRYIESPHFMPDSLRPALQRAAEELATTPPLWETAPPAALPRTPRKGRTSPCPHPAS